MIELITLGDELLMGLTANGHLTYVGAQLRRHGATLARHVTITDDAEVIAAQFRQSWAEAQVVIMTGGLGPTCDDRTREAIAQALDQELVLDPDIQRAIEERFRRMGRPMTANNLKQAYRFSRAEVMPNAQGTAPGLWYAEEGRALVMLPGPPNELQPMFRDQVLPRLVARGWLQDQEAFLQLRTAGIGESALETRLQPVFDAHADRLKVAFSAHQGQCDCRLSAAREGVDHRELAAIAAECAALLGEDFLGYGHDSIAQVCGDLLREADCRLAVAETATGGRLAGSFSALAQSSRFFAGGVVCNSDQAKRQLLDVPEEIFRQHAAGNEQEAVAMAAGVAEKLGADYGLAIADCAGPEAEGNEDPAALFCLALHSPRGGWSRKVRCPGPRPTANRRVVNQALDWLRRELRKAAAMSLPPS